MTGISILALALRLWGIGFGLPYTYHIDEPTYVSAALNLGAGVIGRQPNPTGFSNILFAEYAAYYIAGRMGGLFTSLVEFEQAYRLDPSAFLLIGRLTSAFFGALSILVVFWLAKDTCGQAARLLAACFLAIAFLHVRDSHYAVPDVTSAFFVILAVGLGAIAVRRRDQRILSMSAAAAGFAVAVKWSTWPVAFPLAAAVILIRNPKREKNRSRRLLVPFLPAIACGMGGFLMGGFQLVMKPAVYLNYAIHEWQAGQAGGFSIWQIDTVPGWLFYLKTLSCGLGNVLLVLGLAGFVCRLAMVVHGRDKMSILLLSFPLSYYLFMGASRHYFCRYALPLVPFLALFAGEAMTKVWEWASRRMKPSFGLAALLAVAAIVQPLAQSARHNILLTRQDTRTLAKQWIEASIPEGSRIAVNWPVHGPPLSTPEKAAPYSNKMYHVSVIGGTGLSDHPADWYRKEGFDYLIASSFICNIHLVCEKKDAPRWAFYASLEEEFEQVRDFRPCRGEAEPPFIFDEIYGLIVSLWQRERPGPTIRIYRV